MCAFIILNFIVWGRQGGEGVVYIDASDMRICKNYFNNLSLQSFVLRYVITPQMMCRFICKINTALAQLGIRNTQFAFLQPPS